MQRALTMTAVAALLAAGAGVALAEASSDGRDGKRTHVLHVTREGPPDTFLDLDHDGTTESVGDEDVFAGDFYVGAKKVGTDGGVCKLVRKPAIYHCVATNSFDAGDLTVQFLADFTQAAPGHFAITGGTGKYKGAGGEVTFVDRPDPQRDEVTFRFTTR